MSGIEWVDAPPEDGRDTFKYMEFARELRSHPGEWAVLRGQRYQTASNIRVGSYKAFQPAGSFEAKARRDRNSDRTDVYVRFVGPND